MGQNLQQTRVELGPLEKIYEALERCGSERTLVVLDSVDAMAETCGINQASLITTIQKDLVERRRADFIFVLESNDRYLDYLGDGVIELSLSDHHRRRLREMNLLKLRGTQINQPKYLFTLNGAQDQDIPGQAGIDGDEEEVDPDTGHVRKGVPGNEGPGPDDAERSSSGIDRAGRAWTGCTARSLQPAGAIDGRELRLPGKGRAMAPDQEGDVRRGQGKDVWSDRR